MNDGQILAEVKERCARRAARNVLAEALSGADPLELQRAVLALGVAAAPLEQAERLRGRLLRVLRAVERSCWPAEAMADFA